MDPQEVRRNQLARSRVNIAQNARVLGLPSNKNGKPQVNKHTAVRHSCPADPKVALPLATLSPPVRRQGLFSGGWRTGCTCFAIVAGAVLLVNVVFTVWALQNNKYDSTEKVGMLFNGSCERTATLSSIAHIFINVASSILLGASNYTMQCLSAPTRSEVDKAHERKQSLDIGILSLRNLCRVSRVKLVIWCLLAMSSIPLHFIYNSAVISTIGRYEYRAVIIGESNVLDVPSSTRFERLDTMRCIEMYENQQFITDRSDVVFVIAGNLSMSDYYSQRTGASESELFSWICDFSDSKKILTDVHPPTPNNTNLKFCFSQLEEENCTLQYSLKIMIAVLICNAVKFICILFVALNGRNRSMEDPLVTVGDAIISFLNSPDATTASMCIISKQDIKNGAWGDIRGTPQELWKSERPRRFRAVSLGRWVTCFTLAIVAIFTATGFLYAGYKDIAAIGSTEIARLSFLWGLGLGAVDTRLMVSPFPLPTDALTACTITANLPQAIFSFLYLLYNSLFTGMLLGKEWDTYSHRYRPLRVSKPADKEIPVSNQCLVDVPKIVRLQRPKGVRQLSVLFSGYCQQLKPARPLDEQGSTYFLQLPYKYSLPLLVTSGLVHWLMSQSLFLTRAATIERTRPHSGTYYGDGVPVSRVGWSFAGASLVLVLSTLMLVVAILSGLRRYQGGIPLVGSCSAAISAACHPDPTESSVGAGRVKWGVVSTANDVGHCSFSNRELVPQPEPLKRYAGGMSRRTPRS